MSSLFAVLPVLAEYCCESTIQSLLSTSKEYRRRTRECPVVNLLLQWRPTTTLKRLAYSDRHVGRYYSNTYQRLACWSTDADLYPEKDSTSPSVDAVLYYERLLLSPSWGSVVITHSVFAYLYLAICSEAQHRLNELNNRLDVDHRVRWLSVHEVPPASDLDMLWLICRESTRVLPTIMHLSSFLSLAQPTVAEVAIQRQASLCIQEASKLGFVLASVMEAAFPSYEPPCVQSQFWCRDVLSVNTQEDYDKLLELWLFAANGVGVEVKIQTLVRLHRTLPSCYKKLFDSMVNRHKTLTDYQQHHLLTLDLYSAWSYQDIISLRQVLMSMKGAGVSLDIRGRTVEWLLIFLVYHCNKEEIVAFLCLLYDVCVTPIERDGCYIKTRDARSTLVGLLLDHDCREPTHVSVVVEVLRYAKDLTKTSQ